ncbi:hypothetical protein DFA_10330 [Cavenderia fasciculata]|uniref:Uncharacterized protein n=1 Tax=Cavenderia fasciculata TaxID=261658 RepID=F4Q9X1_CACFS|nr:uncharacterized protein DFA_10330 [Cavenderia fasciculata]EGG15490.1 hypothetical protein DFA_10330 [Cavenderia fasciculata]|eukprot:XP_004354232.1 hypothetical protein DFA_10330 [Cavenderia fasciculata]
MVGNPITTIKYDQSFFSHLQRIFQYLNQDQSIGQSTHPRRLNPPPLTIEYIGIWNQCLESYYFTTKNQDDDSDSIVNSYTLDEYNQFLDQANDIVVQVEERDVQVIHNNNKKKNLVSSLLQYILNQSYLRRQIFNHVSSIHKQLEIETVKVSSLFTLVDYIRYGLNDLFFKHIDQLWIMMFTDSRYRNNSDNTTTTRLISTAIHYNNDRNERRDWTLLLSYLSVQRDIRLEI